MKIEYTDKERLEKIMELLADGVLTLLASSPNCIFLTAANIKADIVALKREAAIFSQILPGRYSDRKRFE
jgi:hypothetical protein